MTLTPLTALSPLDGRYAGKVEALRAHFSEFGLIRNRVRVEVAWLKALAAEPHFADIPPFSPDTQAELDEVVSAFSATDGEATQVCTVLIADLYRRLALDTNGAGAQSLRVAALGAGFTRGSDECLRFTLALLRRLGLQVLLVAPGCRRRNATAVTKPESCAGPGAPRRTCPRRLP